MSLFKALSLVTLLCGTFLWSDAKANSKVVGNPVILELYTSQGCSSCPPADRLFAELIQQPNVIGVACHVDYWDYLSWKDTLSLEACTKRQRDRAGKIELGRVYTPNLVVNGRHSFVGSSSSKAKKAIKTEQSRVLSEIKGSYNSTTRTLEYTLPQLASSEMPESTITLFAIENERVQNIGRGENSGKTVKYVRNALALKNFGVWDGKTNKKSSELTLPEKTNSILLLANDKKTGAVLAYGTFKLN